MPQNLQDVSHMFLYMNTTRNLLQPRYEGPYMVHERTENTFKIQLDNQKSWVSVDRFKPTLIILDDPLGDHSYAATCVV